MFANPRNAYTDASVATASPERLLVMLVERMVLDIQRGAQAIAARNHEERNAQLCHAQEIVLELRTSLDVDACPDGDKLAAIYDYLHSMLVRANVAADGREIKECYMLASQIAEMWRACAMAAVGP